MPFSIPISSRSPVTARLFCCFSTKQQRRRQWRQSLFLSPQRSHPSSSRIPKRSLSPSVAPRSLEMEGKPFRFCSWSSVASLSSSSYFLPEYREMTIEMRLLWLIAWMIWFGFFERTTIVLISSQGISPQTYMLMIAYSKILQSAFGGRKVEMDFIMTTWYLRTYLKLPWKPLIAIKGTTTYDLSKDFKIIRHAESWNVPALEAVGQIFKLGSAEADE